MEVSSFFECFLFFFILNFSFLTRNNGNDLEATNEVQTYVAGLILATNERLKYIDVDTQSIQVALVHILIEKGDVRFLSFFSNLLTHSLSLVVHICIAGLILATYERLK